LWPALNSSNSIANWTVSAVTAIIVAIATRGNTKLATSAAAGAIASKIVDDLISVVYYTQYYYEKRLVSPPIGLENFVVGSEWYTNFYEDDNHLVYINSTDVYEYQDGYVE
jgi:hypothetical protein